MDVIFAAKLHFSDHCNPMYYSFFKFLKPIKRIMAKQIDVDDLVNRMKNRLKLAAADEEVRRKMQLEDEELRMYYKARQEKDEIIKQKDQIIEEKDQQIAHLQAKTEQTAREMAEMREQMALLMQQLSKK
jgi:DNA repair ATPase RecN